MQNSKALEKITLGGTVLSVIFHFIFCGLPSLLLIFSAILGVQSSTSLHLNLPYINMNYMLIISGILIVASFIFYKKQCKCCCNAKTLKFNKIVLIIASILYIMGIIGHFAGPHIASMNSNGEVVQACH